MYKCSHWPEIVSLFDFGRVSVVVLIGECDLSQTNLVYPEVEGVGGELEKRRNELTTERDPHDELLASSLPDYSVT